MNGITTIALVEDHVLFRRMLATFINSFEGYRVIYEASNGAEFIKQTENSLKPELVLLDLNMPVMDGFDTAFWIKQHHPKMQVMMLTMYYSELTLIRLLQAGGKGVFEKRRGTHGIEISHSFSYDLRVLLFPNGRCAHCPGFSSAGPAFFKDP